MTATNPEAPPLRVAVIGYSFMGRIHTQAWLTAGRFFDLGTRVEVAAVCGRDATAAAEFAERFGIPRVFTDWRDVVADPGIDVVDICTPGDTHAEIAIAALDAGTHVLCEKPLANSVADAERMTEAAEAAAARATDELLDSDAAPTAIFAHSDELAMGAMGAILARGLRVPEDIALIGIDDHPLAAPLGLSTVRQPVREQGEIVGRMVLQALGIEGDGIDPRSVIVPTELIARRSTDVRR